MSKMVKPPNQQERMTMKILIAMGIVSIINFLLFFFQPEYWGQTLLFFLLSLSILYSASKKLYMWYNYANISAPKAPDETPKVNVDVLTTYFPGEPYQMVVTTLEAIINISYPHTTYLCDEADDEFLRKFCKDHGIVHVTRDNRKDAKAGNINNALQTVANGDICAILDPDHVPEPDFLDTILPHFSDPDVGFVQTVQSYYNVNQSLVARGAAEQTFQFYGPMMMTLHAYGTVNAIGSNCVFRRKALDSIGGHAPGLCEDMHTSMLMYAKGWRSVYVPTIVARGLGPANLSGYFKQQLKWSRGTLDLLIKVYPRIFKSLSVRQKIHFGTLPLHYLSGLIYLINFLIPILALFLSKSPWRGDFLEFLLVLVPVGVSALLVRVFVQKWVIEEEERGFHILGGILQINTWWIFVLGLMYTILDKKVPFLPTPKDNSSSFNLGIVFPNIVVVLISVTAIVYGLYEDLTPFSLLMAGFAFFNCIILCFGIYLGYSADQKNIFTRIRNMMSPKNDTSNSSTRSHAKNFSRRIFSYTRTAALPLAIVIIVASLGLKKQKDQLSFKNLAASYSEKEVGHFLGVYFPSEDSGLVQMENIKDLEAREQIDFDIVSFYLAWTPESIDHFPNDLLERIHDNGAIPMITWEPWSSPLSGRFSYPELHKEEKVLHHITEGTFDSYIGRFAEHLAKYDRPVFLRFAHEFDNPQYPWSREGRNSPQDFVAAWRRVSNILAEKGAFNVILVWNPWKARNMEAYYPGDEYVDWIGITLLNYGSQNKNGINHSFTNLYEPFRINLEKFPTKPVMLSEFGSVKTGVNQRLWIKDAVASIQGNDQIAAVVLFHSAYDNNIPNKDRFGGHYLDWTLNTLSPFKNVFSNKKPPAYHPISETENFSRTPITLYDIKGVRYKKGKHWRDNYYAPTKETLQKDLEKMKNLGINAIQFQGENIYDRNILRYASRAGMKIIYEFSFDNGIDFVEDQEKLKNKKEAILDKVIQLRENQNVIGFSFDWSFLNDYYAKPLLLHQQRAYTIWLQDLLQEIKKLDPTKAIVLQLDLEDSTAERIDHLSRFLPIDSYGLIVEMDEVDQLQKTLASARENSHSIYISSIPPNLLVKNYSSLSEFDIVLENWQDEWLSNRLTYDGLLDFEGRKKLSFNYLQDLWTEKKLTKEAIVLRILRPAVPLYEGSLESFSAVIFNKGQWELPSKSDYHNYEFQWHLVKTDKYGNPMAFKEVGKGPVLDLLIPADYKDYELLLTAENLDENFVVRTRSDLHTPARP